MVHLIMRLLLCRYVPLARHITDRMAADEWNMHRMCIIIFRLRRMPYDKIPVLFECSWN